MNKNVFYGVFAILVVALFMLYNPGREAIVGSPTFDHTYDSSTKEQLYFGDDLFSIADQQIFCKFFTTAHAPDQGESCWGTTINFQDKSFQIAYGETKPINDYINVKYTTDASIRNKDNKLIISPNWVQSFHFSIYNPDFLELKILDDQTILSIESPHSIKVQVRNNLANNMPGGVILHSSRALLNGQVVSQVFPMKFTKGVNTYDIPFDTSMLGRQDITLIPFVTIKGTQIQDNRGAQLSYNVLPTVNDVNTQVSCENRVCPSGFTCNSFTFNTQPYKICTKGEAPKVDLVAGSTMAQDPTYLLLAGIVIALILLIVYGIQNNMFRRK